MDLFTEVVLLILLLMCWYLVQFYSAPSVSLIVRVTSVLTWVLNFGLALIVPEDLYYILNHFEDPRHIQWTTQQVSSPQVQQITESYLLLYWTVYILTWTIIPVLQQWQNSGDLSSMDRLKRSLKSNGIFYVYMLVGAVVFLVVLVMVDAAGDMGLVTFLKCLASAFGIFLLMILMGYGMVEIPRACWRTGDLEMEVRYLHHRISDCEVEGEEAKEELEEVTCHLFRLKDGPQGTDEEIQKYIQSCFEMIPEDMKVKICRRYKNMFNDLKLTEYPHDLETAIELHRWCKRAKARVDRAKDQYQAVIKRALFAEDILNSSTDQDQVLKSLFIQNPTKTQWYWYCKIKPILKRILASIIAIFVLILLISQTQVFLSTKDSILSHILFSIKDIRALRVFSLAILSFISYLAYYSLFKLKLSNIYGLFKHSSDGPSLMFATINFSRIGVALVINFFDMIKVTGIFTYVMGGSKLGLLGDWVIKGMPGVLWIIVLMHYFDGWTRLLKLVGLDDWGFSKWDGQDTVVTVLKMRRKAMEKQREMMGGGSGMMVGK